MSEANAGFEMKTLSKVASAVDGEFALVRIPTLPVVQVTVLSMTWPMLPSRL